MRILFTITLIGFAAQLTEVAVGAEGRSEGTYTVPTSHDRMLSWYEANRHNVYKAANAEIIKELGENKYLVKSKTPVGASTYVLHETQIDKENRTVYEIKFVKQVSGRVTDNLTVVTVEGKGAKSQVTMSVYINFNHLLASDWAVKRVTDKSVSHTKALMVRYAR